MAANESTGDLSGEVTEAMLRVFNKVVQERRTARTYGGERLTMVEAQICFLIAHGDDATPSAIASATGVTRSAVSQVLGRLRTRGLIQAVRKPQDARSLTLRLTPAGEQAAAMVQQVYEDMRSHVYDATDDELRAFLRLFGRVEKYLDSALEEQ